MDPVSTFNLNFLADPRGVNKVIILKGIAAKSVKFVGGDKIQGSRDMFIASLFTETTETVTADAQAVRSAIQQAPRPAPPPSAPAGSYKNPFDEPPTSSRNPYSLQPEPHPALLKDKIWPKSEQAPLKEGIYAMGSVVRFFAKERESRNLKGWNISFEGQECRIELSVASHKAKFTVFPNKYTKDNHFTIENTIFKEEEERLDEACICSEEAYTLKSETCNHTLTNRSMATDLCVVRDKTTQKIALLVARKEKDNTFTIWSYTQK